MFMLNGKTYTLVNGKYKVTQVVQETPEAKIIGFVKPEEKKADAPAKPRASRRARNKKKDSQVTDRPALPTSAPELKAIWDKMDKNTDVANNKPEKSIGQEILAQDIDVESALGAMKKAPVTPSEKPNEKPVYRVVIGQDAQKPSEKPSATPAPTAKPWAAQAEQEKKIRQNITMLVKFACEYSGCSDTAKIRAMVVNALADKDTAIFFSRLINDQYVAEKAKQADKAVTGK